MRVVSSPGVNNVTADVMIDWLAESHDLELVIARTEITMSVRIDLEWNRTTHFGQNKRMTCNSEDKTFSCIQSHARRPNTNRKWDNGPRRNRFPTVLIRG